MMKKWVVLFLLFSFQNLYSQVEYRCLGVDDSTFYKINNDTTIIVSPKKVYYKTNSGLSLIHDFSSVLNTNEYINDFEIISDKVWYAILRSKFWSPEATLYKTIDKGITWNIDTSYFPATKAAVDSFRLNPTSYSELYQLQKISSDTLILFLGYYTSAIFYSTNAGNTWRLWFSNQINNYRGLFKCDNSYYLWSLLGDGFKASMFRFDARLLLSPDTNGAWLSFGDIYHPPCFQGWDTVNCIYSKDDNNECNTFRFFKNYVDGVCGKTTSTFNVFQKSIKPICKIYPNPATNNIVYIETNEEILSVGIYGLDGRSLATMKQLEIENQINLSSFDQSHLLIRIETKSGIYSKIIIR